MEQLKEYIKLEIKGEAYSFYMDWKDSRWWNWREFLAFVNDNEIIL